MRIGARGGLTRAAVWLAVDAGGSSGISLAGTMISAALIGPDAMGLSAIVLGIAQLAAFPVEAFFADVLVQRVRLSRVEANTAFWVQVGFGACVCGLVAAASGPLARAYDQPALQPMLAVAGIGIMLSGACTTQAALLRRLMRFRQLAKINLASRAAGSAAAVGLAATGGGAWSLVGQYVVSLAVSAAALLLFSGWQPRGVVRLASLRPMLAFAVLETLAQFVPAICTRLFVSAAALSLPLATIGEMNLAFRTVDSLRAVISSAAGRLSLTLFSRLQNEPQAQLNTFRRTSWAVGLATLPVFAALAVCAEDLVHVVFGPAWQGAVLQIGMLSLASGVYFCRSTARYLQTAKGRPGPSLLTGVLTVALTMGLVFLFPPATAARAMLYWLVPIVIVAIVDLALTSRLFGIGVGDQVFALLPGLAAAFLLIAAVGAVRLACAGLQLSPAVSLAAECLVAGSICAACLANISGIRRLGPVAHAEPRA